MSSKKVRALNPKSETGSVAKPHILPVTALLCFFGSGLEAKTVESWYERAALIQVGGEVLDMGLRRESKDGIWFDMDRYGYAAPVLHDLNQDGLSDLVVGGFSGRYRVYLNLGDQFNPEFTDYEWLRAAGEIAVLYNYCCMAVGGRFVDLNQDGFTDFIGGSYQPGAIYWFEGNAENSFNARRMLTDDKGIPVFTRLDTISTRMRDSLGALPATMDWDDDGDLDLVIGDKAGNLVARYNKGFQAQAGILAVPSQPVFGDHAYSQFDIQVEGRAPLPDETGLAPVAADWDDDGLVDIVTGSATGAVYWLQNVGDVGEPQFAEPVVLVPAGKPLQLLIEGQIPGHGGNSMVDVADFNGDGKVDLIVGDWVTGVSIQKGLGEADAAALKRHIAGLRSLDEKAGVFADDHYREGGDFPFWYRIGFPGYQDNEKLFDEAQSLVEKALPYLVKVHDDGNMIHSYRRSYGLVRVYLRK